VILVQASLGKTSATLFLAELTTSYGLDVMDGTEESLFTEVLEQKRTQLLVVHRPTGQIGIPVSRITDSCWWRRRYAANLAAHPTKRAPLIGWKLVPLTIQRNAANAFRIKKRLDIKPDLEKRFRPSNQLCNEHWLKIRPILIDKETHPVHI
jgi:hypothetical protein